AVPPSCAPTGEPYPPEFARNRFLLGRWYTQGNDRCEVADTSGTTRFLAVRPRRSWQTALAFLAACGCLLFGFAASRAVGLAIISWFGREFALFVTVLLFLAFAVGGALVFGILSPQPRVEIGTASTGGTLVLIRPCESLQGITRSYTVQTPAGKVLATFSQNIFLDWVQRRWKVSHGPVRTDTPDFLLVEAPRGRAILRALFPFASPERWTTDFHFTSESHALVWGKLRRQHRVMGCDVLDLSHDTEGRIDRRVALALAVMLQFGEGQASGDGLEQ
ncbi:hypothetical protein HZA57_06905, partial [Candidatus Poribacteria bacterium]|nr:hypothetical protein [Candidatus Poribacteria bacterium]